MTMDYTALRSAIDWLADNDATEELKDLAHSMANEIEWLREQLSSITAKVDTLYKKATGEST